MANIKIQQEYTVPKGELKPRLELLMDKMAKRYQLDFNWQSDECLSFERSGANGEITITEDEVVFTMTLGMLFGAFKAPIEKEVRQFMTKNIQ